MLFKWFSDIVSDEVKERIKKWLEKDTNIRLLIVWGVCTLIAIPLLVAFLQQEEGFVESVRYVAFHRWTLVGVGATLIILGFLYAAWNRFASSHVWFGSVPMLVIGLCLCAAPFVQRTPVMTGDFNIAVADFSTEPPVESELGRRISRELVAKLEQILESAVGDKRTQIRLVAKTLRQRGGTFVTEKTAEDLAEATGAQLVVLGSVKDEDGHLVVMPTLYVTPTFSAEQELTGILTLNASFPVRSGHFLSAVEVSQQLEKRIFVLSQTMYALWDFANHRYKECLETLLQVAEKVPAHEKQTVAVVQTLIGNAAGRLERFDIAEQAYKDALQANGEYSRAYLGLAGVYNSMAHRAALSEDDLGKVPGLVNDSQKYFRKALEAKNRPPLGDIETKANFGLGASYYLMSLVTDEDGSEKPQKLAIEYFLKVTNASRETVTRIGDFVAQAHTNLGLIYQQQYDKQKAIQHYCQASKLWWNEESKRSLVLLKVKDLGGTCP